MRKEHTFKVPLYDPGLILSTSYEVLLLGEGIVGQVWDKVVPILEEDADLWSRGQTLASLKEGLENGAFRLLVVMDAAKWVRFVGIVGTEDYPTGCVLHVYYGTGLDLEQYLERLLETLQVFASQWDCTMVTISGRLGWMRKLKPYGYEFESVRMFAPVRKRNIN